MKVDAGLGTVSLAAVPQKAKELEEAGYDGILSGEASHDAFMPLALAAASTERVELTTGIAVAFARNPMTTAQVANDLHGLSQGRFVLGLGSQIRPHIEKRFSMPWSHPAARMREFVLAMRAIWSTWNDGGRLDFQGEYYRHTLMTPMFDPGPNPYGTPTVLLAAVGERMLEVAGEVADGVILHPFITERYLREVTLPALERGLAASGRSRDDFRVSGPLLVVTGGSDQEMAVAAQAVKQQLAFYGSTPAYGGVLERHGWGDLQPELNRLSKQGDWVGMGRLIDDDMLAAFAVVGPPEELPDRLGARYGDVVDRVNLNAPYDADPELWAAMLAGFHRQG